jgi:hypothetical protein
MDLFTLGIGTLIALAVIAAAALGHWIWSCFAPSDDYDGD